jgi:hypothetical protein
MEWLRCGFGLVNRFIGSSLVVTTISSYTQSYSNSSTCNVTLSLLILLLATLLFPWNFGTQVKSISSQSQSHIATDGQSVSKSWCRAPFETYDQIFSTVWQLRSCFFFLWGALSDERTGLSFVRVIACISKSLISSRHGPRTENTAPLLLRGADYTENKSRDNYLASPLDRWLLPSNELQNFRPIVPWLKGESVYHAVAWQCVDMSQ